MAKTVEREEAVAEVLRELKARPSGRTMSGAELLTYIRRLPKMPEGWTSAPYVREFRGPLAEDDRDDRH